LFHLSVSWVQRHHRHSLRMEVEQEEEQPKTPVTVLTGALGAGKTTLVKYILEKPHGYRVAVIQNEFSTEMGIEAPLITDANGNDFKDIYELPNGCLCCSAKDGLISTLDRLLEERQRFDYVVVEATGTADPEAICDIFWVDDGLGSLVYLDGVVTLVDGRNVLSSLGDSSHRAGDAGALGLEVEVAKQVACADVLLLNKADVTPEAQRQRIAKRLAAMNPTAVILESSYSAVPIGSILGIRAFDRGRLVQTLDRLVLPNSSTGPAGKHRFCSAHDSSSCADQQGHHGLCQGHDRHDNLIVGDHGIESLLLRSTSSLDLYCPDRVEAWLAQVLWENTAGGVYRCKGLFRAPRERASEEDVSDEAAAATSAYALQGVGKLFEVEEAPRVSVSDSKFLFIGRGLQCKALEDGLHGCLRQL